MTVGQFRKFVADAGYQTDAEKGENKGALGLDSATGKFAFKAEYSWRNPGFEQGDDHPVVCVSWNDAVAFCKWLSRKERKNYRLPTEAEWEYACRGERRRGIVLATRVAALGDYAWYAGNSGPRTHAVGGKRPNGFGLYDMHGNACQWCADWYDEHYYEKSPVDDPKGPDAGSWHVARGGSFSAPPLVLRCASRLFSPSGRSCNFGFRRQRQAHFRLLPTFVRQATVTLTCRHHLYLELGIAWSRRRSNIHCLPGATEGYNFSNTRTK